MKKEILEFHAEFCTTFAHPARLEILNLLTSGVKVADPAHYYRETVIPADMNLTF